MFACDLLSESFKEKERRKELELESKVISNEGSDCRSDLF